MDKETKALIDFYDNKIKDLENKNKEKQDKLDEIEEIINNTKLQDYAGGEYFSVKEFSFVEDILQIIKGEDK